MDCIKLSLKNVFLRLWLLCLAVMVTGQISAATKPNVTTWDASDVSTTSATLRGSVNPNGASTSYAFWWGTSSSSLNNNTSLESLSASTSNVSVTARLTGLQPNTTYYYKLGAVNTAGSNYGTIRSFTTDQEANISKPGVTTWDASNISTTSATLRGAVIPNGAPTDYAFWWGTNSSNLSNNTPLKSLAAGTSSVSVTEGLTGLQPNTTYYYKLGAVNTAGSSYGTIKSFTTDQEANISKPGVTTWDASNITGTSATLRGAVIPNGAPTDYAFWWGTNSSDLSNNTPLKSLAAGTSSVSVTADLTGLQPNTTYYYKLGAVNTAGSSYGTLKSLTTTDDTAGDCDFADVPKTNAFYEPTCYLYKLGVLSGSDTNGKMNVESNLKRAHLAKIAFRGVYSIKGRSVPSSVPSDNYPTVYSDLTDKTTYYYQAARALLYLEYGDGVAPFDRDRLEFAPEESITRIHVLKALMETFNIPVDAGDYVSKAASLGIITTTASTFRPNDNCLRGEAFAMLARIMKKVDAGTISDPNPQASDYFEPLNTTLKNIALGVGLPMGNFQHYTKTSFALSGVVPLLFAHTYNSYNTTLPEVFYGAKNGTEDTYQPLGDGWSHNYHSFITVVGSGSNMRAIVHWGGGSIDVYKSNGSEIVPESYGVYDKLYAEGSYYVVKTKRQMEYRFSKQGGTGAAVLYLSSIKDRNGNTLTLNYESGVNGAMRISSVSDGNRSLTFAYRSGTNLIASVSDPLGRKIKFSYQLNDKTGHYQLTSFEDAEGNQTTYTYGDASKLSTSKLLTRIQLPKGNYIENDYDANRRLRKTSSGRNGVPTTQTSVSVAAKYGGTTSTTSTVDVTRSTGTSSYNYTFNENNRVTSMTGEEGLYANTTYGSSTHPQLPTAMQNNKTTVSNVSYDANGNVTSITVQGDGSLTTSMTYDSMNNRTSITDPNNNKFTYTFDARGNLTGVSAPEGASSSISVNSKGLPTAITNAMGIKTTFEYNSYGNLTKSTLAALNLSGTAAYDRASRMTSSTDAMNRTTSFEYDDNDNLTRQIDAENHQTSFEYDANDNLISITNAKNGVTTLTYDNATDWLTSVEFGGASRRYSYNEDGTISLLTKPDGTQLSYSYDDLGRITSDGINSYSYDSKMRLQSVSRDGKTLTFGYDGFNRITSTSCDGTRNTYAYDNNGNMTAVNGTTYTYDGLNRMTAVKFNGKTIRYIYRKDSQLSEVSYPNGMTTTYGYDAAGRLTNKTTKVNGTTIAGYTYELDRVGNITNQTATEPYANMLLSNEDVSYSYNSANRITRAGDLSFSFDDNGNTIIRGSEQYQWDKADRLTRAGSTSISYAPLGLIASYGDITFTTDPLGMGNVLSDSKSGAEYIYGNGLEARIKNGSVSYYVTDFRGSVVAIVDESGNVTHKYQYDEYGRVTQKEEADYNPFQYVGKYGVMALNDHQYYMRARHYDPTIGRFLSEDPIWSTNLYPYADNNPIMRIDPKGEIEQIVLEGVGEALGNEVLEITDTELLEWWMEFQSYVVQNGTQNELSELANAIKANGGGSTTNCVVPIGTIIGVYKYCKTGDPMHLEFGVANDAVSIAIKHIVANGGGPILGAIGCGVGMAIGIFLIGQDAYKAYQNFKQSESVADFFEKQNENGGLIYKGSQWVGNQLDNMWDAILGPIVR